MMLCGVIELHARTHTTEYISIQNVSPKSKKCQSLLALVRRDKEKKKYTRRRQDGDGAMTNEDVARNREITRQENHRNLCQSQSYAVRTLSFSPLILPSNQNNAQELTPWRRAFTSLAEKKSCPMAGCAERSLTTRCATVPVLHLITIRIPFPASSCQWGMCGLDCF